jgi:hypothetical protein
VSVAGVPFEAVILVLIEPLPPETGVRVGPDERGAPA